MLALETAVALVMLVPAAANGKPRAPIFRHGLLLTFCLVTYAFAPVAGFGWLLLVMGAAQIEPDQQWLLRLYVAAFLVVLFYSEVPWAGLMLDWLRAGS